MRRVVVGLSPIVAALAATVAGFMTPGYDPVSTTVSRLAVPGAPAAWLVDFSMALLACSCFALRASTRLAQVSLTFAGAGLLCAASIHLDPASPAATWAHRAASAVAVTGLVAAPFAMAKDYGAICLVVGWAELAMLGLAGVLLATPFDAWGLWERVLLTIPLTWMVLIALTRVSAQASDSAPRASASKSGSYAPVRNVTSAKP